MINPLNLYKYLPYLLRKLLNGTNDKLLPAL